MERGLGPAILRIGTSIARTSLDCDDLAQRSTTTCRIGIDAFIRRRLHCRHRCLGSSVGRYEAHRNSRETETMKLKAYFAAMLGLAAAMTAGATDLVIATVNNPHMIAMQKHTPVSTSSGSRWKKASCASGSPPISPPRAASSM